MDPRSILAFFVDCENLCNASRVNEGTTMNTFQYFLRDPAKSLYSKRIVYPDKHQKYYEFDSVLLSTDAQVVY